MTRPIRWNRILIAGVLVVAILLLFLGEADAWLRGGGTATSGAVTTLFPLTGGSLPTNRGTVTFANSQGPYGFNVLLNGQTAGLQATKLTVSSGLLVAKYDTNMPSSAPQTACLVEITEVLTNLTPNTSQFQPITCPGGF